TNTRVHTSARPLNVRASLPTRNCLPTASTAWATGMRTSSNRSRRCHQEALAIFQQVQDQHGVAETLDLLGMVGSLSGDPVQSAAYYWQVVELFQEMDNREGLVSSLATLLLCGDTYFSATLVTVATSVTEVR